MAQVYVGMGSNIDPERHIRSGLVALRGRFGSLNVSTIYANPAVGFVGADFLNLVAALWTALPVSQMGAPGRGVRPRGRGG